MITLLVITLSDFHCKNNYYYYVLDLKCMYLHDWQHIVNYCYSFNWESAIICNRKLGEIKRTAGALCEHIFSASSDKMIRKLFFDTKSNNLSLCHILIVISRTSIGKDIGQCLPIQTVLPILLSHCLKIIPDPSWKICCQTRL